MRNAAAAAIPLAIALLGTGTLPLSTSEGGNTRVRIAASAPQSATVAGLTDDQERWLEEHNPFGIPETANAGNRTLVVRQGYSLAHNNVDLIADWVSFHLTNDFVKGTEKRPGTNWFKPDPLLPAGRRAELSDYEGQAGFDRGHQCASGDSKGRGVQVIRDSFLLSNMTPQSSQLNQQRWRLLEAKIQELAATRGELWVITGPAFVDDDGDGMVEYDVIGDNEVAVPTHYFKIVVAESRTEEGVYEAMAFLFPNKKADEGFDEFLVSIRGIEELTGFDFIKGMDDEQEIALETAVAASVWVN
jgi:endonuclease G